MALRMKSFELLGGFIELNLSSLCLSNFLLEFCSLSSNFDGKLLNLKSKFLDLSLISSSVLLESQVILFLLSGRKRPLLQFFLVPVHLKFELVHLLIRLENLILDVVETILLVSNSLL